MGRQKERRSAAAPEDENELVRRAKNGNDEAFALLMDRYRNLIRWHIRIVDPGVQPADEDDYMQEGWLGLMSAVRSFEEGRSGFSTYASVCIRNALRQYRTKLLKTSGEVPLPERTDAEELTTQETPESLWIDRESAELLLDRLLSPLSPFEREVAKGMLKAKTNEQIARALNRDPKSIANAVFRIRDKLRRATGRQ